MERLAIIPARAGSKGLKDKNIMELCGKPLLAYAVEAAKETHAFGQIVCSTDSHAYADIAAAFGAEVVLRSAALAGDTVGMFDVVKDVLDRRGTVDLFVLLQPTSPLRQAWHISEALNKLEEKFDKFDFLVSVKEAEYIKRLVNPIAQDGSLKHFDTDFSTYCRQQQQDYSPNGAIFIAKPSAYLRQKHFFGAKSLAYIMSKSDSVDIDDFTDFRLASLLMEELLSNGRI